MHKQGIVPAHDPYMHFNLALTDAIMSQAKLRWHPMRPSTFLGKWFYAEVKKRLPPFLRNQLRLYCAIGTRFDFYHDVDGFFTLGKAHATFNLRQAYGGKSRARNRKPEKVWVDVYIYKCDPFDEETFPHSRLARDMMESAILIATKLEERLKEVIVPPPE